MNDEIIEILMKENEEFRNIKNKHTEYHKILDEYEKKPYLTPQEQIEVNKLKKIKLKLKDKMEEIISEYKKKKGVKS